MTDTTHEPVVCESTYTYNLKTGDKIVCISTVPEHERHFGKAYGLFWYWRTNEEDKK